MTASNSRECLESFIGARLTGVLLDAYADASYKTLIFDDGRGLTFSGEGAFWAESKEGISRAIARRKAELKKTQIELEKMLKLATGDF
jgi:hypothetical protein